MDVMEHRVKKLEQGMFTLGTIVVVLLITLLFTWFGGQFEDHNKLVTRSEERVLHVLPRNNWSLYQAASGPFVVTHVVADIQGGAWAPLPQPLAISDAGAQIAVGKLSWRNNKGLPIQAPAPTGCTVLYFRPKSSEKEQTTEPPGSIRRRGQGTWR